MTHNSDLAARVECLAGTRVLCIGDVMLDQFVYGQVDRISPEAPIPVFRVEREAALLGGAGNVVRNVVALGGQACFISVVGDDHAGRRITALVGEHEEVEPYLLVERQRQTTVKTRYVAGGQQLLRADSESVAPIPLEIANDILRLAEHALPSCKVVVLSDYGKGVLKPDVAATLIRAARAAGLAVVVDPKGRDYARYRGASVLTPNRRELAEATGLPVGTEDEIVAAARHLIEQHDVEAVLVTRSQDGMTLVAAEGSVDHLGAEAREVFDVSGAGDTVTATLAAGIGSGAPVLEAARLASIAAGIVVGKVGTAVAYPSDLMNVLHQRDLLAAEAKVLPLAQALERVQLWRRKGLRIGFTNGCFDLLHPGHVSLLSQARAACDRLVVGLNSDASVARLKGPGRPIQPEAARAAVLASLASVDLLIVFAEDTPMRLIEAIRPDVLVKGADYTRDEVVGGAFVESYGGRILLAQLSPGFSTTATIARMASR